MIRITSRRISHAQILRLGPLTIKNEERKIWERIGSSAGRLLDSVSINPGNPEFFAEFEKVFELSWNYAIIIKSLEFFPSIFLRSVCADCLHACLFGQVRV